MLGNFIYSKTKDLFEEQLNAGNILDEAVVFIEDTKQIWNHGTYFDCNVASEIFEEYKNSTKQSIDGKVDKVSGKQLSTEDFTTALKSKLEDLKIHKKIYRSLDSTPSEDYGWYMIAEIDDTESTLFQISTGGHSDVIFTVSTGWGGNLGGSLTILNSYFSEANPDDVNEHHAHVVAVRIRKNNNKVQVEVKLRNPSGNNSTYVNIVVSAYTNAGHDNFLQNSLNLASSDDNTLQTFELKNRALMSEKVVTSEIQATNLATVATSGNYNDLSNKPTAVTENTVSGWGFTKNAGTYSKPENGIPKDDLSEDVQNALEKSYDLPIASETQLGGVKIGTGLDILNGSDLVLNVNQREFNFDPDNKQLQFGYSLAGTINLDTLVNQGIYNIHTTLSNITGFVTNTTLSSDIIKGRLTVFNNGTKVTQILTSSLNEVYFRTGVYVDTTPSSYNWTVWKVFQQTRYLGNIGSTNFNYTAQGKYEGICNYYTGEISDDGTEVVGLETFILFVLTQGQQISQLKYSLKSDGSINIEVRTGVYESVAKTVWDDWKPLMGNIPEATQEILGGVKLGTVRDNSYIPLVNIEESYGSGVGIKLDSRYFTSNEYGLQVNLNQSLVVNDSKLSVNLGTTPENSNAISSLIIPCVLGTTESLDNTMWNTPSVGILYNKEQFCLKYNGLNLKDGISGATKVTWDYNSNMNNFKTAGVYDIYGERTNSNDNLPISNASSGHSIAARLTVVASTLQPANTEICITQFLMLSNRLGGDGNMYVRTYNQNNGAVTGSAWSPWQKQMGMVETLINSNDTTVGQEIFSGAAQKIGDGLNGMIDNGMYSGMYIDNLDYTGTGSLYYLSAQPTFVETFVLVVINDYAASGKLNLPRHITQLKYAVDAITGQSTVKRRVGTGSETISWGDWTDIGGGGAQEQEVDVTEAVKYSGLPALIEQGFAKEGVTYKVVCAAYEVPEIDNNNKIKEHIESKRHSLDDTVILSMKCYTHYGEVSIVIDSIISGYSSSYFKYIISSINTDGEEVKVSEDMTIL